LYGPGTQLVRVVDRSGEATAENPEKASFLRDARGAVGEVLLRMHVTSSLKVYGSRSYRCWSPVEIPHRLGHPPPFMVNVVSVMKGVFVLQDLFAVSKSGAAGGAGWDGSAGSGYGPRV
jgi:hypothetical protein